MIAMLFRFSAPDQTVVPVAVTEILILVEGVGLGGVVLRGFRTGLDGSPAFQLKRDIASQPDGAGDINSGGEINGAATRGGRRINGSVNGIAFLSPAVPRGAELLHIEDGGRRQRDARGDCHAGDPDGRQPDHWQILYQTDRG